MEKVHPTEDGNEDVEQFDTIPVYVGDPPCEAGRPYGPTRPIPHRRWTDDDNGGAAAKGKAFSR